MTRLFDILAKGLATAVLATCALARSVLNLGVGLSKMGPHHPPKGVMVRLDVPPVE